MNASHASVDSQLNFQTNHRFEFMFTDNPLLKFIYNSYCCNLNYQFTFSTGTMTFKKLDEGVIELKVEVPEKDPAAFLSGKTTVSFTISYC